MEKPREQGIQRVSRGLFPQLLRPSSANRWVKVCLGILALYAMGRYFKLTNTIYKWFTQPTQQQCGQGHQETFLGVYHAVDPCIYSEIYPESPNTNIKEVADLMTELYELFIQMRYLDKEGVAFPPHISPKIDISRAAKYGLTKNVVDLMQMVPYRTRGPNWNHGSDGGEFLFWGEFMDDMRQPDADWWRNVVDPFYAIEHLDPDSIFVDEAKNTQFRSWDHEQGPYMRPWFVTMTNCGNHGSVMVLDTESYNIWLINQLGGSTDPIFKSASDVRETKNHNDLNQYPSRPARDFLRDVISSFRSLEWIPGGLYDATYKEYNNFKKIYTKAGWPDNFDPLLFDGLRNEMEQAEADLYLSYEPIKALDETAQNVKWRQTSRDRYRDVTSRLDRGDYSSEEEREELMRQQENLAMEQNGNRWVQIQDNIKKRLVELKAELDLLLSRQGRFSGLTDEELATAIKDRWFADQIDDLEVSLADKNEDARRDRMLEKAKIEAARVTEDTWSAFVENEAHSTVLTPSQLRRIIDEDLDVEDIETMVAEVMRLEAEGGRTGFWM